MHDPRSRNKPTPESPEITTGSATMGRETLVAIAEDEADQARALLDRKVRAPSTRPAPAPAPAPAPQPPAPAAPRGHNVLPPGGPPSRPGKRSPLVTLDYDQKAPREDSSPEVISIGVSPMGRETLAAITGDLAQELMRALSIEERSAWLLQLEDATVLEPFRFEVRSAPMLARPSDALRREFVATKLLHRLPVRSIDDITRIDVSPTADDALTLTVWVKIPESRLRLRARPGPASGRHFLAGLREAVARGRAGWGGAGRGGWGLAWATG